MEIHNTKLQLSSAQLEGLNVALSPQFGSTANREITFDTLFNTLNNKDNPKTIDSPASTSGQRGDNLTQERTEAQPRVDAHRRAADTQKPEHAEQDQSRPQPAVTETESDHSPETRQHLADQVDDKAQQPVGQDKNQGLVNEVEGQTVAADKGIDLPQLSLTETNPPDVATPQVDPQQLNSVDDGSIPVNATPIVRAIELEPQLAQVRESIQSSLNAINLAVKENIDLEDSILNLRQALQNLNARIAEVNIDRPDTSVLQSVQASVKPAAQLLMNTDLQSLQAQLNPGLSLEAQSSTVSSINRPIGSELVSLLQQLRDVQAVLVRQSAQVSTPATSGETASNNIPLGSFDALTAATQGLPLTSNTLLAQTKINGAKAAVSQVGEVASLNSGAPASTPANRAVVESQIQSAQNMASLQRMATSPTGSQSMWADEVQGNVKMMLARGLPSAELLLKPASLGALSIRIESGEEGSLVQFSVQSTVAKEQIEMHLPRLRELFAANQLSLGDVSVSSDGNQDQLASNGQETFAGNEQQSNDFSNNSEPAVVADQIAINSSSANGLLDVYA